MRKTIEVQKIRKWVNHFNEHSLDSESEHRIGHNSLMGMILQDGDNYRGFGYVAGYGPNDPDYDDSRRIYY